MWDVAEGEGGVVACGTVRRGGAGRATVWPPIPRLALHKPGAADGQRQPEARGLQSLALAADEVHRLPGQARPAPPRSVPMHAETAGTSSASLFQLANDFALGAPK